MPQRADPNTSALGDLARLSGLQNRLFDVKQAVLKDRPQAYSPPPAGHDHWTLRLLAGKVVELKLASSMSHEGVASVSKRPHCSNKPESTEGRRWTA